MSASYVSKLERGAVKNPGLLTLEHIANVHKVTVTDLLTDSESEVTLLSRNADPEYQKYLEYKRKFDNMPAAQKERAIKFLEFMFEEEQGSTVNPK